MNYNALRYFVVLARYEHYGKAAEELGISQPSLSNAISRLEDELGVYLFEKQGRNVHLTYYGKLYLEYVEQGLSFLEEGNTLMAHCADREHGIIRIGAVSSAGPGRLLPIMNRFLTEHPHIRFQYMDGTSLTLLEELKKEEYDLVVSAREMPDPDLLFYPLWDQRFVAIVPPGHPLAACASVSLAQVGAYPLIRYHSSAAARKMVDDMFREAGVKQISRCFVSDDFHIAGMVAAGLGIALMVGSTMPDLYGLRKIPIRDGSPARKLYLVTRKNAFLSESCRDFLRMVKETWKEEK